VDGSDPDGRTSGTKFVAARDLEGKMAIAAGRILVQIIATMRPEVIDYASREMILSAITNPFVIPIAFVLGDMGRTTILNRRSGRSSHGKQEGEI